MKLNESELSLSKDAIRYVKVNKNKIIEALVPKTIYKPVSDPVSLFLAGSPGAGKTEFSKILVDTFKGETVVRIDADEVRDILPQYHANSYVVQGASALGVEKIYDYSLKNKLNIILDGTFADYDKAYKNISRSLHKERLIEVYYILQDPFLAWTFTKKREYIEGRNVPKDVFINAFFSSRENVNKIKSKFSEKIMLNVVTKDYKNNNKSLYSNVDTVENVSELRYNRDQLLKGLK